MGTKSQRAGHDRLVHAGNNRLRNGLPVRIGAVDFGQDGGGRAVSTSKIGTFSPTLLLGVFGRVILRSLVPLVCRCGRGLGEGIFCAARSSTAVRQVRVSWNYFLSQGRDRRGLFHIIQIHLGGGSRGQIVVER